MKKTDYQAGMGMPMSRTALDRRPPVGASSHRGFTLIEILTVVVILGIVSMIVIPQVGSRDDLNAAVGARVMMSDLMYAQNLSITTQKMHYVQFNTATQTYSVYDAAPLTTPMNNPITNGPYTTVLGPSGGAGLKNCQIGAVNFDGKTTIAFDELGCPYSYDSTKPAGSQLAALASGTLTISSGAVSMTVSVAPYTGNLSVSGN